MANDIEHIKQYLRQTPTVKARETAKKTAISLALAEFDKNNLKTAQENNNSLRLMVKTTLRSMTMKTHHIAMLGTLCVLLLVLTIVPMQTQLLDEVNNILAPTDKLAQPTVNMPAQSGGRTEPTSVDDLKRQAVENELNLAGKKDTVAHLEPVRRAEEPVQKRVENVAPTGAAPVQVPVQSPVPVQVPTPVEGDEETFQADSRGLFGMMDSAKAPPVNDTVILQKNNRSIEEKTIRLAKPKANLSPNALLKEETAKIATSAPYPSSTVVQPATDVRPMPYYQDQGRDKFEEIKQNPLKLTKDEPVSTFSIDVDTASYSFVRASLNQNVLPQKDAVRVEELINYFPYQYQVPTNKEEPFKANVSVLPTPWNKDTKLIHIGIKGYQLDTVKPTANLVFLIDTSGSMNAPNKLPLVQNSLKMLLDNLNENDSVAIVTYAGNVGVALEPTKAKEKNKISSAIDHLWARGSTAGAEGIRQAYLLAEQNFNKDGINRVILATDGDFNVGITDQNELKSFIERQRATGVTLSVLGFGMGNYNDALMQTLAQNGNGNAAYIDSLNEARKALVEEAGSTLFTIAKDVKIQVEFNPEQVSEYRLIGYETRLLKREDFNNDKVDAGDIGAGHSVTALYEITPVNSSGKLVDDLRYQKPADKAKDNKEGEYAFVKIRYKLPNSDTSKLITTPVDNHAEYKTLEETPIESRFATSVAAFGQLLRNDPYLKDFNYDQVINLAENAKGTDKFGYRAEFINLVRIAKNAPALPALH